MTGAGPVMARCRGVADDGAAIVVEYPAASESLLVERWPPLGLQRDLDPTARAGRRIEVTPSGVDVRVVVDGAVGVGGWDRVESELALFAAEHLHHVVAVHAAVVVIDGRAVVVPGPSGAGKSMLCVAAAAAGAQVLTDEYALIDPSNGLVTGWRRAVRMRRPTGGLERIDLVVDHAPVEVAMVALLTHHADGGTEWSDISPAEAVLGLLANTVCAQARPDASFDAALAVSRNSIAVRGVRGDASEAVQHLRVLVHSTR